jgi:hypothetical protein
MRLRLGRVDLSRFYVCVAGKPNSALTVLDFAMRHGLVPADHEYYVEVAHMLRGAFACRDQQRLPLL